MTGAVPAADRPRSALVVLISAALVGVLVLLAATPEQRLIYAPLACVSWIPVAFICALWYRDARLPVFEVGTICVGITALYCAVPLLNFIGGGMRWTFLSDVRLQIWDPTPAETGGFAWRHVLYLASLATTYLVVRGPHTERALTLVHPPRTRIVALVMLSVGLIVYFYLLQLLLGVSFAPSYSEMRSGALTLPYELPYFLQQISSNLYGIQMVLKQALLVFLLSCWQKRGIPAITLLWIGLELALVVARLGGRSEAAFLLLTTVVLYHRFVKPLGPMSAVVVGFLSLTGVLAYGLVRDYGAVLQSASGADVPLLSGNNEFQGLFATSYDLFMLRSTGVLPDVPLTVYLAEFVLPIPSQFLPFQKMDAALWYLDVVGLRESGFGGMFGVISQGVIGLDWPEFFLRGAVVGTLLALLHRWYVANAHKFWVTVFYVFMCAWIYFTYRAGSFYIVVYILYHFVSMLLMVWLLGEVLRLALVERKAAVADLVPAGSESL